MTLRKILIGLGLLIVFLPYIGFPQTFDTIVSTAAGLIIVLLLSFSHRGGKLAHFSSSENVDASPAITEDPREVHIERVEVSRTSEVRVAPVGTGYGEGRKMIPGPERATPVVGTETVIDKKVMVVRRRQKKAETDIEPPEGYS